MAKERGRYKLRIIEITLINGTTEVLVTNLDADEFSLEELIALYGKRWSIETGFKKLKSQIMIERFSGHRRRIIEQDFHASIFLYNLATAIQWDAEKQMYVKKRKPNEKYVYKALFSSIVGIMYIYMEYLLSFDFESINTAIDFLIEQAKRLYHQKNIKKIRQEREEKIMQDLLLQAKWG